MESDDEERKWVKNRKDKEKDDSVKVTTKAPSKPDKVIANY